MTVLTKILSVLAVLLLAGVVILLWFVLVPRKFRVEYSKRDGLIAKVRFAFFKITLYPLPRFLTKKAQKPQEDKPEEIQPEGKKENPLKDIRFSFDLVKQVITAAKGIVQKVFAAIKFNDVSFTLPVYAGQPEKTQQAYGAVTNSFYALSIFLQKHINITFKSPIFVADFANTYGDAVYFYTQITASPIMLLFAGYFAFTQYNQITQNNKKTATAEEKELSNG